MKLFDKHALGRLAENGPTVHVEGRTTEEHVTRNIQTVWDDFMQICPSFEINLSDFIDNNYFLYAHVDLSAE